MISLDTFPHEILDVIADHLDNASMARLSQSNHSMNNWTGKSSYWRKRVRQDFRERYDSCYSLFSLHVSFSHIYALEKARREYTEDSSDLVDIRKGCRDCLKLQITVTPFLLGPFPVACGIAVLGALKAIKMALDSGIFGEDRLHTLRQKIDAYLRNFYDEEI